MCYKNVTNGFKICNKYDFLLLLKDFRTLFYFQPKFELFPLYVTDAVP